MMELLSKKGHEVFPIEIDGSLKFLSLLKRAPKYAILCLTEDIGIQWILDLYGIKYNGSGPLATMLSLDKVLIKTLVKSLGINTPGFITIKKGQSTKKLIEKLKFPLVVKPARSGSSHGISLVENTQDLKNALKKAFLYDTSVLLEEFIKGTEITIVCLDNKILGIVEIRKEKPLYDYETKLEGFVQYIEPPEISKAVENYITKMVPGLIDLLELKNLFRIDAIVKGGKLYFLEINTLPFLAEGGEPLEAVKNKGFDEYRLIAKVIESFTVKNKKRLLG